MQGFLLRSIQRRLRRMALGATFGLAAVTTTALFTDGSGDPTTDAVGMAARRTDRQAAGCEHPGESTMAASRTGPGNRAVGPAVSCAGGDLYIGNGDRPDRKSVNRPALKQQN